MYKCKHFVIQELVPPQVYKERGEKSWELIDDRSLITLDRLREKYGPITVNNWHTGGEREWSGLRTPDSPYYSKYSQHSFGRAIDCIFKFHPAEYIRQAILKSKDDPAFEYINSIELGVSWVHFDIRNCDRIFAFNP